jgi:hypothetical protein
MLYEIWVFHGGDYEEFRPVMLRRVAFLRTNVSEERTSSIMTVASIGEIGTALAVTSNRRSYC